MKKIDSLNLVPFIDIMLVLLVIVLVSASFTPNSNIQLDVPKVDSTNATGVGGNSINVSIDKHGSIFVNNELISSDNLSDYLSTLDRGMSIIIKSDKDTNVQSFMDVFGTLQMLGFDRVFMEVTQP